MNVLLGIIVVLSIFSLIIYLVIKKKIWLIVISGIIIIIIVGIFISASSDKPDKPKTTDKTDSTTQQQPRVKRTVSGTFTIPDGVTVTVKNMYYIYGGSRKKRDKIIVEVLNGPYRNLLWLNKNLPAIQIKKPKTIIYACPPGINKKNKIKFTNMGGEPITVRVRIIPYRT